MRCDTWLPRFLFLLRSALGYGQCTMRFSDQVRVLFHSRTVVRCGRKLTLRVQPVLRGVTRTAFLPELMGA